MPCLRRRLLRLSLVAVASLVSVSAPAQDQPAAPAPAAPAAPDAAAAAPVGATQLALPEAPKFETTSAEPVTLRYKFKAGQVLNVTMDVDMRMKIKVGGQELSSNRVLKIEAKAVVDSVDANGQPLLIEQINRLYVKTSGLEESEFDTAAPNNNVTLKSLETLVNVKIPCRITDTGKVVSMNVDTLKEQLVRADNKGLHDSVNKSIGTMFQGTFVQLSEEPVKAGETFQAGTLVEDGVTMQMAYELLAVSADGSQAILKPVPKLEVPSDAFPGAKVKVASQSVEGWLLFDVANGRPGNGATKLNMVLELDAMGEVGTIELEGLTTITTTMP